jgi:hypothetical protein
MVDLSFLQVVCEHEKITLVCLHCQQNEEILDKGKYITLNK